MKWSLGKILLTATIIQLCINLSPASAMDRSGQSPIILNSNAIAQLNAVMNEKANRTEAQKKIDSNLLYAWKKRNNDPLMASLPALIISVETDEKGMTLVDIKATVSPELLQEIERLGGTVINSFTRYNAIRARMPLEQMENLAENPDIRFIQPAVKAICNKVNTSEGDKAHNAASARSTYSVSGSGVKVGVLSDSVDHLADVQATGDLPSVVHVIEDDPGNTGEGTAMLEIVHDLAPGADLYFATAWKGPASFASNILALEAAGCDVIVDDISYLDESPFQDDVISQAVNTVTSKGVLYFSSAGNYGNMNDNTSKAWEGDYVGSTSVPPALGYGTVLDFGGGDTDNEIMNSATSLDLALFWSDPMGASGNDYDLYVLTPSGDILVSSANFQDGDDDPVELISAHFTSGNALGCKIVVARWGGVDRFIHLASWHDKFEHGTAGQIRGHCAAEDGFGVAAVSAHGKTTPFTGSESIETFSSDGPRRVFYYPDGTPITPGNVSSTGGTVRQKPDLTAADGVQTATPGFNPFYGTSAAAPHAAAIGALMRSKNPAVTIAQVRNIFNTTALDIEASGFDRDSGCGIIMADDVLNALIPSAPTMAIGTLSITDTWHSIYYQATNDPVFIAGPPTYHGTDPGVIRLRNITAAGEAEWRFQEWLYKDGVHATETVSGMVISSGRYTMPDGSIWEAGKFSTSGTGAWATRGFSKPFPGTPALFLTVQTYNGADPVSVRARDLTNTGFKAAMFEEENKMDGHTAETIGYLAIYSPHLSGTMNTTLTTMSYLLQAQPTDQRFTPVLSADIKIEEEQSRDSELNHTDETVAILYLHDNGIGIDAFFTQDITTNGADPASIRCLRPEYGAAMEWGTVDGVDENWIRVPFAKSYLNPVVVARPVSSLGGDPGVIRIRNVSQNSFELRYNEWAYEDGAHTLERVFYMVAEAGTRSVAGLTVEAGTLNTSMLMADGWEHVTFAASFSQFPDVFTSVQTFHGVDPVTTRIMHCTASGFDLTMQEEEAKHDGHVSETIGWIAIKRGMGSTGDSRFVSVLKSSTTSNPTAINFGHTMARRFPVVISDMISTHGTDPGFLRYQDLGPASIKLFVQEETSADPETGHIAEDVSLFVAE